MDKTVECYMCGLRPLSDLRIVRYFTNGREKYRCNDVEACRTRCDANVIRARLGIL